MATFDVSSLRGVWTTSRCLWLTAGPHLCTAGHPLGDDRLGQRLQQTGLNPRQDRSTVLFALATERPAAVLARMLGIHFKVAIAWQQAASGDWNCLRRRRQPPFKKDNVMIRTHIQGLRADSGEAADADGEPVSCACPAAEPPRSAPSQGVGHSRCDPRRRATHSAARTGRVLATVGADYLHGREKIDAVNTTRQILLAAVGGTAILVGLGFTSRTYYLSRQGQLTDRYTKAITQLASDKVAERVGGIYALEHLMRESTTQHSTVVAVLAAFIRERASTNPRRSRGERDSGSRVEPSTPEIQQREPKPATDVQAALTVLARRPAGPEPDDINLSDTDLRGADLRWAQLERVQLGQSWLQYANLSSANLKAAFMRRAQLQHAWLVGVQLDEADLIDAQLEQANLGGTQLRNTDLRMAGLRSAHLRRADLTSASLAAACLEDAYLVDAQLRNAHLAGTWIGGRVHMKSIGDHSKEKKQDQDFDGAQLRGANLAGAKLHGARLATSPAGKPAPVQGITVAQLAEAHLDDTTELLDDLREALADHLQRQQLAEGAAPTSQA